MRAHEYEEREPDERECVAQFSPVRHLYVHVPFCGRRCSYCDFSIAVRAVTPISEFVRSIALELDRQERSNWELDTVYLGGGTPSRLGGAGLAAILRSVHEHASVARNAEVTIEANPDDVTPAAARAWRSAGVNRVSLGAQSFNPEILRWMHRTHSTEQTLRAVAVLRDAGIDNISLDLIFALPSELQRDWSADLDAALALEPEHLSLYGLTVEPKTPLGRWHARGSLKEAPEESYEREFMLAHTRLGDAGFRHYEVSNFGLPGRQALHNSAYWSGVPYAAVGPSAHSFDGHVRSWNTAAYSEWARQLDAGSTVIAGSERLTPENRLAERVYLGLRTDSGLSATDAEIAFVRPWVAAGWARVRQSTIALTAPGFLRLDALAASLTGAESH